MPATSQRSALHDDAQQSLAAALRELDRALERFIDSLTHEFTLASVEHSDSERDALRRACAAYSAIDYTQDQAVNETPTCLGVIGATAATIARAHDVNAAKTQLRDTVKPIQNQRVRVPVKDGQGGRLVKSLPLVRVLLREMQRSDLNLLAAYRKIPVLTGRLERVAYVRARTRAVYRKSRDEILRLLENSERPDADADRTRIARLPAHETHFALVEEHYDNVRANVWFHGLDSRNRGRTQMAAALPLLFPLGRSKTLPEIVCPDTEDATASQRTRTGKLDAESFLTTYPVFRYRAIRHRPGQR